MAEPSASPRRPEPLRTPKRERRWQRCAVCFGKHVTKPGPGAHRRRLHAAPRCGLAPPPQPPALPFSGRKAEARPRPRPPAAGVSEGAAQFALSPLPTLPWGLPRIVPLPTPNCLSLSTGPPHHHHHQGCQPLSVRLQNTQPHVPGRRKGRDPPGLPLSPSETPSSSQRPLLRAQHSWGCPAGQLLRGFPAGSWGGRESLQQSPCPARKEGPD